MGKYNWQQSDWPHFRYDLSAIQETLLAIAEKTGLVTGKLAHLTDDLKTEALMKALIEEAVKTSEIEGEYISRPDVCSSIKNKLGLNPKAIRIHDKRANGIVDLLFDVRKTFQQRLTKTTLFEWHLMLLASSINPHLQIACWRNHEEPMQIVSGRENRWLAHFEAPPSKMIPKEMQQFIRWFNGSAPGKPNAIHPPAVRAAIAHLYFESIHPFEDGNGRMGRAIAEKALSQGFGYPCLLSLSQTIEREKKWYYDALHDASKSNEITVWIHYFVNIVLKAQIEIEKQINFILKKTSFFESLKYQLNDRQLKIIRKMIDAGLEGFEGSMSAKKYMKISETSKATATRDLQNLLALKAFKQVGGGRSIRYELNL